MPNQLTLEVLATWVRGYLRDYDHVNRLLAERESSDKDIKLAALAALSSFNSTPPITITYTIANFPRVYLLMIGTVAHLLTSIAILKDRNYLPASGEGVASPDNPQITLQLGQTLKQEWDQGKDQLKVAINIAQSVGQSVSSDYVLLSGYLDELTSIDRQAEIV